MSDNDDSPFERTPYRVFHKPTNVTIAYVADEQWARTLCGQYFLDYEKVA